MEIHILYCIFCHRIVCCFTACGSFWWFKTCFPHSWLITGFVTIVTRWVPLVEKELLSFTEHLSSPAVFSGVRVTRSLVLYVCFVDQTVSRRSLSDNQMSTDLCSINHFNKNICDTQSLVFCSMFCFSFCPFSSVHSVDCHST
jgi:hypothetical protein